MSYNENVKIVTFVGLTGAGKSSAVDYLTEKGYPKVYFGGVILQALDDAGLEHTEENERTIRESLRASEGNDFIAQRIIKQINDLIAAGQNRIVADGLYSWTEYKVLKAAFPGELSVIAIIAPKRLRHSRLNIRPIRPLTDKEADERDWAEIGNLEKGGPIAIADHFVMNDGDRENFETQLEKILQELEFYT
jgi:dephospho-CoA kinase